jgi:SAM-dependent methyltransferase
MARPEVAGELLLPTLSPLPSPALPEACELVGLVRTPKPGPGAADPGVAPSIKGALPVYEAGYNRGIVARELRRMWERGGFVGVMQGVGGPLARAAIVELMRRAESPTFRWEGGELAYLTSWSVVLSRASAGPLGFRLANVLSKLSSERSVEIPIARAFARRFSGLRVLEVGNVMSSYMRLPPQWDVIDRYEVAPGVRNEDIVTVPAESTYDAVISISTLEHVGWDEPNPDPKMFRRAITNACRFLRPGGEALITVPLHYNPGVDEWAGAGSPDGFRFRVLVPVGRWGSWTEVEAGPDRVGGRSLLVVRYRAPPAPPPDPG